MTETMTENTKINEAIYNFYKLKKDYETNYYEKYVKPIVESNKSIREKKSQFQKLPKAKCINCRRNVGTIFSIKANEKLTYHKYSATCGDISDPCPLNIQIQMPNVETFDHILQENVSSTGTVENVKKSIIKAKNDLLFGYIQEKNAFELFENLTNQLKKESELFDFYLEKYIMAYDSPERIELLNKKKVELEMNIQELQNMMDEFNKSGNEQYVHNAVESYVNNMIPQLKEIQELTYAYNKVEYIDDTYILVQKKNTLEQLDVTYADAKIESYVIGNVSKTKNKNLTLKNTNITNITNITNKIGNNKTRKQKPVPEFIIEESDLDEDEDEEEED
jgi:hypothetical protein